MAHEDGSEVEFRLRALHQADQNQASAIRQRFHVLAKIRTADTVEDNVGASPVSGGTHLWRKWSSGVIDRNVGAEAQALFAFGVGARGHYRSRMCQSEQLNRRSTDAAATAMNQHRLA